MGSGLGDRPPPLRVSDHTLRYLCGGDELCWAGGQQRVPVQLVVPGQGQGQLRDNKEGRECGGDVHNSLGLAGKGAVFPHA